MKKHSLFIAIAILFAVNAVVFGSSKISFQPEISKAEYEIYSAVIEEMYATRSNTKLLIIKDHTVTDSHELKENHWYRKQLAEILSSLLPETINSYVEENKRESQLKSAFNLKISHTLIKKSEIGEIFKRGTSMGEMGEWDEFRKRFPDARNVIGISHIGFSFERNQALVYLEEWCGSLCGTGNYFLLSKEQGKWKVIKRHSPWIS